jgi:hypothetical protein
MVVNGSDLISPLDGQSTLVGHDKKILPSSTLGGPDQLRELQAVAPTWVQVGDDIDGEDSSDWSGWSVAVSDDGMRVAIGAPKNNNENGNNNSGHVRVYDYKSSSGSWVQVGNDIDGKGQDDWFGTSVAMSDNGMRVASGAWSNNDNGSNSGHVRVYDYKSSSDSWVQVGQDIVGEASNDESGRSVAMSDDGMRVAIGAPYNDNDNGNNSGHVRVYDYDSSSESWVQVGQDIDGESDDNYSGHGGLAMSDDGMRVAIGAAYNNGNGNNSGHVRVYEYDSSSESWVQVGNDIYGVNGDTSGRSVAISDDGMRVAIGANSHDGDSGRVSVYDYKSSSESWVQVGNDIDGQGESGRRVAMSDDGMRVAIGAHLNGISGKVLVYDYDSSSESWIQAGNDIAGEAHDDYSGYSVAISGNGMRVASGAYGNDNDNGNASGHVRVYSGPPLTFQLTPSPTWSPTPSPTGSPTFAPATQGKSVFFLFLSLSLSSSYPHFKETCLTGSFEIHSTGDVTGTPITDITIELLAPFNASNRVHETIVLSPNCIDDFTGTAADAFNVTDTPDESLGSGFISYVSKILVDISKMNNTGYWKDLPGGALGGVFGLCLESAVFLMLDGTNEKMNFVNTNLTVTVEMDADFQIKTINAERKDASEEELTLNYSDFVTAYQCEKDSEDVQLTGQEYSQGDVLKICVKSTDSGIVQVGSIKSLTLSQAGPGAGGSFPYITDGIVADAEIAATACDNSITPAHVCHADMQLLGRYFSVEEPGELTASGSVELTFSTGRRLTVDVPVTGIRGGQGDLALEKNSARLMEEKPVPEDGSFGDVKVSLKSLDGSGGSEYYGATLTSALVVAAGGAILMV